MTGLSIMDLPFLVETRNGRVDKFTLVGVLVGEVQPPPAFEAVQLRNVEDTFALLDLVGVATEHGMYYAKGQVLTVVHKGLINEAQKKRSGRMAIAIHDGSIRNNARYGKPEFISMCKWSRGRNNAWQVGRVSSSEFSRQQFPEFFNVIAQAYKNNWQFTFPVQIPNTYTPACDGETFTLINPPQNYIPPTQGVIPTVPQQQPQQKQQNHQRQPDIDPSFFNRASTEMGASFGSDMTTLIQNRAVTHAEVKNRTLLKVENRDKILPPTRNISKLEGYIKEADEKVQEIIQNLDNITSDTDTEPVLEFTAKQIKTSWNRKMGSMTGRALFKEAVERILPDFSTKDAQNNTEVDTTLNALGTRLVDEWIDLSAEFEENKLIKAITENRFEIYLQMIEIFLGTWGKLVEALPLVSVEGFNIITILEKNPYSLCYIDPRIGVEELDKLAMMYGIDMNDPQVITSRNVAYMHNFMLDSSNDVIGENTVIKYKTLLAKIQSGYILSKRSYDNLQLEGSVVKREQIHGLTYFIRPKVREENFELPKTGWIPDFRKYRLPVNLDNQRVLKDYIDSGLGVYFELDKEEYVSDFIFAKKEMYIYNQLHNLYKAVSTKEISKEDIEKCISDFEKIKAREYGLKPGEFKLEQRQADAVRQINNPIMCLTGPAGSGKTTTAEALVYAIETLLGVNSESIMFCAPTGKAANRLKEVVKRKTRTINSLFQVGGDSLVLKEDKDVPTKEEIEVLIVDESSMPNVNLMYDMLMRVHPGTRIFFLGDIEQLPPIGFGKPFATMLTYLPTVVLNVTKRASDNSGITLNSKALIYESDGVTKDLVDRPDFRIIHDTDQQQVVQKVKDIVNYHLYGKTTDKFKPVHNSPTNMNPDDIQVITPVNKHDWGTVNLNKELQDIFNPRKQGQRFVIYQRAVNETLEFRVGDRVTHTRQNHGDRRRLRHVDGPSFVSEESTGINNGEVGKILGFYRADSLDFSREKSPSIQKDLETEFAGNSNVIFLGVQYRDLDAVTGDPLDFVILYRMELVIDSGTHYNVISRDLMNLDLAYALTVHKLQGSEAPLVITVMLPAGRNGFISRNMLYTAVSRGKKSEYLLGDILGPRSTVNRARKIEQTSRRASVLDKM